MQNLEFSLQGVTDVYLQTSIILFDWYDLCRRGGFRIKQIQDRVLKLPQHRRGGGLNKVGTQRFGDFVAGEQQIDCGLSLLTPGRQ